MKPMSMFSNSICGRSTSHLFPRLYVHEQEFYNVRLGFLHNRTDILSWRQAFAWHQVRLSQVWENVKLHAFIYTWSVLENVCVYNIILIGWLYTISFGHIIIGWCYCHVEDVSPHFDGMLFLVADVNNHWGWCFCLFYMLVFGRCYCQVTVADAIATYNTEADVIAFCVTLCWLMLLSTLCGGYYFHIF